MSVCGVFLSLFVSCCSPDAESRLLLVLVGLFDLVVVDRLLWVVAVGPSLLGCSGSVAVGLSLWLWVGRFWSVAIGQSAFTLVWFLWLGRCCSASVDVVVRPLLCQSDPVALGWSLWVGRCESIAMGRSPFGHSCSLAESNRCVLVATGWSLYFTG